jgi:ABC-type antimicrobial peptide transport system permease subunit
MVGVLGVITLFTTSDVISRQLDEDVKPSELAMINLTVSVSSDAELDNALYLQTLNRQNDAGRANPELEGITAVEGWAYYAISYKKPDETDFRDGEIRAYSAPLQDIHMEPMRLIDGEWAEAGGQQVNIEKRLAEKYGFAVGDPIVFRVATENGVAEITYTVAGIVFHPYSTAGLAGELPGPDMGIYMQYEDAQSLLGFTGYTAFVARYQTYELAQQHFEGFVRTVSDISPYVPVIPSIEDPVLNDQVVTAGIFAGILNSLAIATMLVSGFLVVNVVNTIIAEQKRQIGILKSLGATRWENFLIYSGIAFAYGLLGTLLAIIPGILIAQVVIGFLAPELDIVVEGFKWSPLAVLIGVVMGLVIPIFAAALPVFTGTRVTIMEAITDLGISGNYSEGLVARVIGGLPVPISARQALSNVWLKKWRLVLTGTTLTLTVATFMGVSALAFSLSTEIRSLFDRLGYQIIITPNEIQDIETMEAAFADVSGVNKISPATIMFVQMPNGFRNFFTQDNQIQVFAIDPTAGVIDLTYTDGTGWDEDPSRKGMVISTSVSRQLDVHNGDTINVTVGGRVVPVEIIGVDEGAFDAINMRWDQLSEIAGILQGAPTPNRYMVLPTVEGVSGMTVGLGWDETELAMLIPDFDPQNPGVVISGDLALAAELQRGDAIQLTVNGAAVSRPVVGIVPNAQLETLAGGDSPVPPNVVLFGFHDLVEITGVSTEGEPVPNSYYIFLDNQDATTPEVDEAIAAIQADLLGKGIPARYVNQVKNGDLAVAQVNTNVSILMVAVILIAIMGAIGLLTTLTISVFERQKEIGVMRSIGAGSGVIAFQFMLEGMLVGFVSWVIGLIPSYYIALLFNKIANLENVTFRYAPIVPLIGLVGILTISALASLGPSISAARKTVSDILRYQ